MLSYVLVFTLSCWCSMVLVMTFFLVSSIYRTLQVWSNWYTSEKLFGSSFDLFLHIKFFKLCPEVKNFPKLAKKANLETRLFFELYTSDPIPAYLYSTNKAHKPEKYFPVQVVVSILSIPPYGI